MHHLFLLLPLLALSLFLFLPWQLVLLLYAPILIVSGFGFWKGLQALRRPIVTGEDAMIGQRAVVIHADHGQYEVEYEGEIWRAVSDRLQSLGQQVVIKDVKGLTLHIESLSQASQEE